jgi:hypothetical protein
MRHTRRILTALSLAGLGLLNLNPTAHASQSTPALTPPPPPSAQCNTGGNGSVCFWSETVEGSIPDWADCGTYLVAATYTVSRSYITFYDASGNATREIRHISFTGTLTSSLTGASVPYEGHFVRTEDFVNGTLALSGLRTQVTLPGGAKQVLAAGNVSFDATGDMAVHGPDNAQQVCTILS